MVKQINALKITAGASMFFWILLFTMNGCSKPSHPVVNSNVKKSVLPKEFHLRNGLPNFFSKINRGENISVAYIGGSITESDNGWRGLTYNWLRINYPQNSFSMINATIGGTGSKLGVFRMDRDVLAHKPDLLFVEFAVNDSGDPDESVYQTMEGIVRKTWKSNPSTDIIFVYTIAGNLTDTLSSGRYHHTAVAMEKIAEHYKIPSIHMGVEVARLIEQDKLVMMEDTSVHSGKIVFSRDNVHPLIESGHPIYANVVMKYLQRMASDNKANRTSSVHILSTPFVANHLENAQMISLANVGPGANWQMLGPDNALQQRFSQFMPKIYKANSPSATLSVKFKGNVLGFYDLIGPGTGIIDLVVDGKQKEVYRFDPYCLDFRKHNFFVDSLSNGMHEIIVRVSGKEIDKEAIILKRSEKLPRNYPQAYLEKNWYLSNILVAGDSVEVSLN